MSVLAQDLEAPVRETPFAAPHVFILAAVDGKDERAVHRLMRAETIVGCRPDAHLRLEGEDVAERHCTIRCDAGQCHIVDTSSGSGTFVNARRLTTGMAHRLRHQDEIRIGAMRFLFLCGRFIDRPQRGQ